MGHTRIQSRPPEIKALFLRDWYKLNGEHAFFLLSFFALTRAWATITQALADAVQCVSLRPTWAKAYSRQGAA
eukprot:3102393-Rhodomonas_salina.1